MIISQGLSFSDILFSFNFQVYCPRCIWTVITEFDIIGTKKPSTAYVVMDDLIK